MTRRCQWCVRLFTGDVCPGCGADHVIHITVTAEERAGLASPNARPGAQVNAGVPRATRCHECDGDIPRGKGARRYCGRACQRKAWSRTTPTRQSPHRIDRSVIAPRRAEWIACHSRADRAALAASCGVSIHTLYRVAREFGWPVRPRGRRFDGSPNTATVNERGLNAWNRGGAA